ncbi:MAG: hypothetical protein EAZ65_03430 [Verrucomicrobia bacterium]|nr:MAG: hypothetical protein EAZ84_06090 [Verrucomicrobiota bacterium]TAE88427.1 MAG: hypothetical protein EAZ82_04120 [Verrucomicrobiota bacterium]TAF26880.1 MAG: hypothetical protein EAZ71_03425 [Verrucomicrobiota bacterium]TAF42138.1 MAG: hypothetical protein EAZ65_03430 [Verrucomicrobiota bacterium]
MYFFSYQPLKERLKNRKVCDREALPYLVVFSALTAAACLGDFEKSPNGWDYLDASLAIALAIVGVIHAYRQNGGASGFDLIQKYVVLGWVVSLRCLVVLLPCAMLAYSFAGALELVGEETTGVDVLISTVFGSLIYYKIGQHIGDTRSA